MSKHTITHTCGHAVTVNLVGPMRDRDSRAAWLAGQPCLDCKRAAELDQRATARDKAASETADMVALTGSDKQIAWATTIRATAIAAVAETIKGKPLTAAHQAVIDALHGQSAASWWIDNRVNGNIGLGWLRAAHGLVAPK